MIRDSDGWRVPRLGTHARVVYGLMKYGLSSREIAELTGYKLGSVRVVSSRNGWYRARRRGPVSREWRDVAGCGSGG